MSSMISYFNDRILSPEMMRAMIILYIGPHNRPDFATDYLLSPLLAPESFLARFPKTYFLTGERDPLVDDTVIFAGRLRQAQKARFLERKELGLIPSGTSFREDDVVEVCLVPGISHGFLQFAGIFPDGWKYIFRCAEWICESFDRADAAEMDDDEDYVEPVPLRRSRSWFQRQKSESWDGRRRRHHRARTDSSGDEDRPLEMTRIGNSPSGAAAKKQQPSPSTKHQHHHQHHQDDASSPSAQPANGQTKPPGGVGARTVGRVPSAARGKRKGAAVEGRKRSLVSLASEDDLLGRRMKELAGGLMGLGNESQVPPTP
jgi:hypothetical protein